MSNITVKKVAKYVILPGIIPRVRKLFDTTFGMIAFLIAQIYSAVRLLPPEHAYLQGQNIGRFGVRHVVAEAANHLVVRKENWDQIVVFVLILSSIILMIGQVVLVAAAMLFDPVWAASTPLSDLFATPDPTADGATNSTDVVFLLMDRVFGVPKFFCTVGGICTDVLEGGQRWPFHVALHSMFAFYSKGLLIVGVLIFLYFIVVVVGETVTSGTPFGERFQNIWVPIRLVMALLLLTPMTYGLNAGQWLVLSVAKAGSGFATNGWHRFNNVLKVKMGEQNNNPSGEISTLLATPKPPDLTPLVQGMVLIHGCAYGVWDKDNTKSASGSGLAYFEGFSGVSNLDNYPKSPPYSKAKGNNPDDGFYIQPYFVKNVLGQLVDKRPYELVTEDTTFQDAVNFYGHSNIIIRFGHIVKGQFEPVCGDITVPVVDRSYLQFASSPSEINSTIETYGGGPMMHSYYFDIVRALWFGNDVSAAKGGQNANQAQGSPGVSALLPRHIGQRYMARRLEGNEKGDNLRSNKIGCQQPEFFPSCSKVGNDYPSHTDDVNIAALSKAMTFLVTNLPAQIDLAHDNKISAESAFQIKADVLDRGWGGAGLWYNKIAQMNGQFVSAVNSIPYLSGYPEVMKQVKK